MDKLRMNKMVMGSTLIEVLVASVLIIVTYVLFSSLLLKAVLAMPDENDLKILFSIPDIGNKINSDSYLKNDTGIFKKIKYGYSNTPVRNEITVLSAKRSSPIIKISILNEDYDNIFFPDSSSN